MSACHVYILIRIKVKNTASPWAFHAAIVQKFVLDKLTNVGGAVVVNLVLINSLALDAEVADIWRGVCKYVTHCSLDCHNASPQYYSLNESDQALKAWN